MKSGRFRQLNALPQERPKTKAGQILWLWPEIKAALDTGHTLRETWEALTADGVQMAYSRFRFYVARLRRADAEGASQLAPSTTAQATIGANLTNDGSLGQASADPLANVKEREAKRPKFEYSPGIPEDKLF